MPAWLDRLRVALRTLRKQRVFTAVVILSLGLAIALNTSMYGVLDALVHPRTDIRDPDRLFWLQYYGAYKISTSAERDSAVHQGVKAIEQTTYFAPWVLGANNADSDGIISSRSIAGVGPEFFPLLGGRFVEGRAFIASDEYATPRPIVINELLAAQLFPGRQHVLGEQFKVGDSTYSIIGVLSKYTTLPEF